MQTDEIRIDVIDTPPGCREHERLANLIWGDDPTSAVPTHLLIAVARNGGVVLGAYSGGNLVGMLVGVPSIRHGRLMHLSHMMGVHPDWRGRGIADALKWRQREIVMAQGIDTIHWTFDPLETLNARLNVAHLGGIVRTYTRDYYGEMEDALNRGMPSDRFTLEWLLDSARVRDRAMGIASGDTQDAPVALGSFKGTDGLRMPGAFEQPTGSSVLIEIPLSHQEIKRRAPDVALEWRMATRDAFERLFAEGYVVTGVTRRDDQVFYYLENMPQ